MKTLSQEYRELTDKYLNGNLEELFLEFYKLRERNRVPFPDHKTWGYKKLDYHYLPQEMLNRFQVYRDKYDEFQDLSDVQAFKWFLFLTFIIQIWEDCEEFGYLK